SSTARSAANENRHFGYLLLFSPKTVSRRFSSRGSGAKGWVFQNCVPNTRLCKLFFFMVYFPRCLLFSSNTPGFSFSSPGVRVFADRLSKASPRRPPAFVLDWLCGLQAHRLLISAQRRLLHALGQASVYPQRRHAATRRSARQSAPMYRQTGQRSPP